MAGPNVEVVDAVLAEDLVGLYSSVGWSVYASDPDRLARAVAQSSYVAVVRDNGRLVGLVRGLSDDVSILYVQDLLVHPGSQGRGVGRALLASIIDRYRHVRQKVLLTDDEARQHKLYESFGLTDVAGIERLHAFARFDPN